MLAVALEHYIWNCSEEHEIFYVVVLFSRLSNKCLRTDGETFANPKLLSELKIILEFLTRTKNAV